MHDTALLRTDMVMRGVVDGYRSARHSVLRKAEKDTQAAKLGSFGFGLLLFLFYFWVLVFHGLIYGSVSSLSF